MSKAPQHHSKYHPGTKRRSSKSAPPKKFHSKSKLVGARSKKPSRSLVRHNLKVRLLAASQSRCVYCGTHLTIDTITMDHIYPQRFGGPDMYQNLAAACQPCNGDKAHMHPEVWFRLRPCTAAGFILLARNVSPQYLATAAEIINEIDSPYAGGRPVSVPMKIKFMAYLLSRRIQEVLDAVAQINASAKDLPRPNALI